MCAPSISRFASLEICFYLALGICPSVFITEMVSSVINFIVGINAAFTHVMLRLRTNMEIPHLSMIFDVFYLQHNKDGILEMALSGFIVISGIFFFKADGMIPFAHAIWHCFVAAGAAFHYYAILKYLYILTATHDYEVIS